MYKLYSSEQKVPRVREIIRKTPEGKIIINKSGIILI